MRVASSFAMLLVATAACSSTTTPPSDASSSDARLAPTTDGAADSAPADAGSCKLTKPYSSKDMACNACAEGRCCCEINACDADADCDGGYVNCILACALLLDDAGDAGISACLADCAKQYPTGKTEYDSAIGCAETKCAAECQ